jgi:type IV pilus assembly protein PilX
MFSERRIPRNQQAQHGAVLILALIFMVLLMILATGAVNTVVLEERMAGNMRDKNLSLQAAEATLAMAEKYLAATPSLDDSGGNYPLTSTRKPLGDPGRSAYWTTFSWNAKTATEATVALSGVATTTHYLIEQLPPPADAFSEGPTEAYRITVRAVGGSASALTMLQAIYTR